MIWIVVKKLREQRPLVYYILAGILFILAQLAYFLLSRPICNGANAKIDGSFLATALETATVIVLYLAWQGITEGSSIFRVFVGRCAHKRSGSRLLGRGCILPMSGADFYYMIDDVAFTSRYR